MCSCGKTIESEAPEPLSINVEELSILFAEQTESEIE